MLFWMRYVSVRAESLLEVQEERHLTSSRKREGNFRGAEDLRPRDRR